MQYKLSLLLLTTVLSFLSFTNETGVKNLYLDSPKDNTVTIKNSVIFSGQIPNGYSVFINNEKLETTQNEFQKLLLLNKLGKHSFDITFLNDQNKITIQRNIIKLKYSSTNSLTQSELAFINTNYTSNRFKYLPLKNQFQKTELAYFLNQFLKTSINNREIKNINDLKYNKYEVQNIVNSDIFSLDKNGNFNEFESINTVILLAALRKTFDFKTSNNIYPELNQYKGAWFYNDLVIALDKGLLKKSELNTIKKKLNNASFIKIASRLKNVQNAIASELTFPEITKTKLAKINKDKKIKKKKRKSHKNLIVNIDINSIEQVSKTSKKIFGTTNLNNNLTANYRNIKIDDNGEFELLVPLRQDKILFKYIGGESIQDIPLDKNRTLVKTKSIKKKINKNKTNKTIQILAKTNSETQIKGFSDLNNHWVKDIANELKRHGKLDQTENFNPKQLITREELAKHLVKINGINTKNFKDLNFNDVSTENSNYSYIQTVYSKNIINGIDKTTFSPKGNVTRIQALVAISRILPAIKDNTSIELPFKDISNYKWANKNLQKAYYYKIISPSDKLNPKNKITKAELITLLYKASNV